VGYCDVSLSGVEGVPSKRLVEQRIRNNIIEYLELASSYDEQLQYQANVPIARVPAEVICIWEDNVPSDPRRGPLSGVFSEPEVAAVREFHAVWERVCAALPEPLPSLTDVQALEDWDALRSAARAALDVFQQRGRLPDDREV